MASVPIIATIASELRSMRKLSGPLDAAKLSHTRAILKGLGGGDAAEALARLESIARLHRQDQRVSAAFASLGFETESETVLGRLEEFAVENYVDTRTVRRWSDAGIDTLSNLIVGADPWLQPILALSINWDDLVPLVLLGVKLSVPPHIGMNEPVLTGGEEPLVFKWGAPVTTPTAKTLVSDPVSVEFGDDAELVLEAEWRGDLDAAYSLDVAAGLPWRLRTREQLRGLQILIGENLSP